MTKEQAKQVRIGDCVFKARIGEDAAGAERVVVERLVVNGFGKIFVSLRPVLTFKGEERLGHPQRMQAHALTRYSLSREEAVEALAQRLAGDRDAAYRAANRADAQRALAHSWLHLNDRRVKP